MFDPRVLHAILVAAILGASPVSVADPAHDVAAERLAALKTAARCNDAASVWRSWCFAAAYATGTAAALPTGKILVGLTIELETGKDVTAALSDKVSFTAWAVGSDGKVKLTDVKPTSDDETKMVFEAVGVTAMVLKGGAKTAKLPADLAGYLKTLKGSYATTKSGDEWTWTGATASRARKVGAFWVVLETPEKQNGVFATVLTDAWE